MVGHSGTMKALLKKEKVDSCVGKLLNSIGKLGGSLLITADHGNSEMMLDQMANHGLRIQQILCQFICRR